ncbi:MAG TPA: DUF1499 domain-containing protein [Rhodanobacteraceae bacterium]|nr:DUF1499 domain-containing protein [Rhodanobacteraceae bacterium]
MKLSYIALLVALVSALVLLASGPGVRLGWWAFPTGFQLLRWAACLGLAAAVLAVIFLIVPKTRAQQSVWLVAALVIGLAVAYVPWHGLRQARSVPPIHDITTDTANPPRFVAILPLRAGAANPATYGGAEVAAAQRKAYADIRPHRTDAATDVAFKRALAAARAMDWDIVASDAASGRIEATATTTWFGFKDDIVIRVAAAGSGSVVDVRSVSRVGKSDVGTNARRIRAYLKQFDATAT